MMYSLGMASGWFGMDLWWIIVVAAVVCFVRMPGRGRDGAARDESALEMLSNRYAHGAIGRDEYEQKTRAIGP